MEPPETTPHPIVLTDERLARLRAKAMAARSTPQLDFAAEVEPLIQAEVEYCYYACAARLRNGIGTVEPFVADFQGSLDDDGHFGDEPRARLLATYGIEDVPPLRLAELARPFDGEEFEGPGHFRSRLLDVLRSDVEHSIKGPLGSPRKAAFDSLRRIRPLLPAVVDFGGLLPASHQDFLERFEPLNYLLSAGPPDEHVEQLVALVEAGVVHVVGPAASFGVDHGSGRYFVESPRVPHSRRLAEVFVDARVPATDVRRTASTLIRRMVSDGTASQFVNADPTTGDRFETGGLAVTRAPFHVVNAHGESDPDIYAIGVATDRTRWFTQVGTGRPGRDSPFRADADAIATDILGGNGSSPGVVALPDREEGAGTLVG
jgi:methylaspartate mutase epsilon subunit